MKSSIPKLPKIRKKHIKSAGRTAFWFSVGALITLFLISSFSYFAFQNYHKGRIYPGVKINGIDFGNKSESEVRDYFLNKNKQASDVTFVFSFEEETATVSAKEIEFGYDENLLTIQALSIGRSNDPFSNINLIIQAYTDGINLSPAYRLSQEKLE